MRNRFSLIFPALILATSAGLAQTQPSTGAEPIVGDQPLHEVATSTIQSSGDKFWVGEVFTLTHQVSVARRAFQSLGEGFEWSTPGLNVEDWTTMAASDARLNGEPYVVYTQTAKAYSRSAGVVTLPSALQPVVLITGVSRSDLTSQTTTDSFKLPTKTPQLEFKPLPAPAPLTFYGAVGDFNLVSRVPSKSVAVGESITWTLELSGTGSWPEIHGLPPRTVSKDFTVVKPVSKLNLKNGTLFAGTLTEDVLLVPTKAGAYQLGPMRYTYFDTKLGKYQMITTETIMVSVGGSTVPGAGAVEAPPEQKSDPGLVATRRPVAESPAELPLDPLTGQKRGLTPFSYRAIRNVALIPLGLVVLFWLKLAADRRRLTDPQRRRREARSAIGKSLQKLDTPGQDKPKPEVVREQMYRWQQATARYWNLGHPVPKPGEISDAVSQLGKAGAAPVWLELWKESEATLHGKTGQLSAGWTARAKKALQAAPLPEPPLHATFYRRNLLPYAGLAVFLLLPVVLRADAAQDAYMKGDFAAAEKLWQQAVSASPTDAFARYNLALAQAQQDRWAESTAQSLAAFCLDPGNPTIRRQFKLALDHSGIDHPLVTALANRESFFKIAGIFSPAQWAVVLELAALVAALCIGFILWAAYAHKDVAGRWTALFIATAAMVTVILADISIKRYGLLANKSIAVVSHTTLLRSIPTELGTTQKMVPLAAGSLGSVTRNFLGWSQLSFPNGQTGWVRSDYIVHLYE